MTEIPGWVIPHSEWSELGRWWPTMLRGHRAEAVILHHSVTDTTGLTGLEQAQSVDQVIYSRRFSSRFTMVAYNWLIDTHGVVYEGRGTKYRNGANNNTKGTEFNNSNTTSVCFIGNYHPGVAGVPTLYPTVSQLTACARLIQWLEMAGDLPSYYKILPHSYMHSTACCGDHLREQIPQLEKFISENGTPGGEMFVTKVKHSDTHGRVWFGSSYFESDSINHWESVVGEDRVFVDAYLPKVIAGLQPLHPPPAPTVTGPSAKGIAKEVIDAIRKVWE